MSLATLAVILTRWGLLVKRLPEDRATSNRGGSGGTLMAELLFPWPPVLVYIVAIG